MTVYLRPINLQHTSGIQSQFRLDPQDIQLLISRSPQSNGIYELVRKYDISELLASQHPNKQQKFIAYAASFQLKLQFKSKVMKSDYGSSLLNLGQLLQTSCYSKNDILTKFIVIGEYKLGYQFKCNRFLQVCGTTVHKSLSVYAQAMEDGHDMKPLQMATFKDMEPGDYHHPKEVARANRHISESQLNDRPLVQKQVEQYQPKRTRDIVFYKGPCESNNLFSCLDGQPQARKQKKFQVIQKPYI